MPKIQIIQQETSPNNLGPAPQLRAERVTSAVGDGFGQIARGLDEIRQGVQLEGQVNVAQARLIQQQEENDAAAWSGKVLSDTRLKWDEQFIKSQETAEPGAAGFTPKLLDDFDKYSDETLKSAPTETAKRYLGERLATIRTALGQQALGFEATARRDYRINQTSETINNNAKMAQDNPAMFGTLYAETNAVIDALEIPPKEKLDLKQKAKNEISYATVLGEIQRDPQGMAAKIRGGVDPSKSKLMTHDGLPARKNADGSYSTEVSITVTDPRLNNGKPTNIPSLWGGKEVDEDTAVSNVIKSGKTYQSFDTIDSAVKAAKAKSEAGGAAAKTGDFKSAMEFIFAKEGGYNPNDGNGPVNFGINQAANPDVDVKNLTKTRAESIYKTRYWDAINGDQLPAGVAIMAMDTAVNQGVAFAKKILTQSGGDIQKMAELRREKYASLVEGNPAKYGKYAKTWGSRVTEAEQLAMSNGGSGVGAYDVATITPDQIKPTGDPAVDMLSFDQRIRLLQHADTLSNQQMALAKEQLRGKLQDFTAMASTGTPIPEASIPSVTELTAAYGAADGLKIYNDDVKPMLALNNDLQRFSTLSVADRQAMLAKNAPPPGDGFYEASKRYQIMQQADVMLRKEMDADPAAYAMKYAPTVSTAFKNLQDVPATDMAAKSAAANAFVTATMAEQQRLGVTSPAVLPKSVTDNIVRQFFQQQEGGQNAALLMQQQAELWGKNWPMVYGQMAKDLPGSALVIGSGMKPQAAEMLARASAMPDDELKKGILSTDVKSTSDAVQDYMTEFLGSLSPMAGGDATFNTFYEQTNKLALMYVRNGEKPSKAAERAYIDTVGSKYEFVNDANNASVYYRVPVQYDVAAIENGANMTLQKAETLSLSVPQSLAGLDSKQAKSAYVSAIKNSGYWVTAPDESGLMLYANGAVVMDAKGKPLVKTWDQLSGANVMRNAQPAGNPMTALPADSDFFDVFGGR